MNQDLDFEPDHFVGILYTENLIAGRILLIFSRLVDSNQHKVFFLLHLSLSGPKHLTGAHLVVETGWKLVLSSS